MRKQLLFTSGTILAWIASASILAGVSVSVSEGVFGGISGNVALAQESGDDIENLFANEPETENDGDLGDTSPEAPAPSPNAAGEAKAETKAEPKASTGPIRDVTDLSKLQPFNDVAVIQKRFLPKSQRFEAFIAPTLNLNDAFFWNFGLAGKFAYYFQERYGIELSANYLTVGQRGVTEDLLKRGVRTTAFVTPRLYYGADFKWSPVYGKMTWANKKITPFDLYFTGGGGLTETNQGTSDPTLHLGTGQIFAFSKNSALRWDFSWNMFMSQAGSASGQSSLYHNLFFSIGWSVFFPEANYR